MTFDYKDHGKEKFIVNIEDYTKENRSEEHTSELQSPSIISYAVFCLKKNFFNDTATTEIYTLSLHDALPISFSLSALASAS